MPRIVDYKVLEKPANTNAVAVSFDNATPTSSMGLIVQGVFDSDITTFTLSESLTKQGAF